MGAAMPLPPRTRLLAALALLLAPSLATAQEELRLSVDWRVLDAGEFRVHYPGDAFLPRAREVAQWLESARVRLEKTLDHDLDGPISVILYRSHLEYGQNFDESGNPGGLFPIIGTTRKRRIVVPCVGSDRSMQRTIEFQVAQAIIDQRHYTSSTFRASLLEIKSDVYADWVPLGVAAWVAGPAFTAEEMLVRDAVLDGELRPLSAIHAAGHLGRRERYPMLVESAFAVGWIEQHTPRGSAKRLMHVFDSDFPWPAGRLMPRATGLTYTEVEDRFAAAMEARYRPWAAREEADRFARRLRDFDQHYRFAEIAPAPSPDGRKVAFFEDSAGFYDLVVLDVDAAEESNPLRLQLHVTIDNVHPDPRGVDWSPDGRRLCFVGDRDSIMKLYLQPADGGAAAEVQLPFDHILSPQWSPDGRTIVFSGLRHGSQDLYLLDVATLDVRRLTTEPWPESEPAWSPDGRSVAFTGETAGQTDLWRIDLDSRRLERLTETPVDESSPSFHPGGASLAFTADPGGAFNVFLLDLATSAVTRVTDVPGGALAPRWTPDGRAIVFSVYRHGRFTTWSTPPRTAPAPADFADTARAENASRFTRGLIETYQVEPYESHIRFESILPTGARLSDILEHHRLDTGVDYKFRSGGYDLGMDVTYTHRSLRPDLYIGISATTQKDSSGSDSTFGGVLGISYPVDTSTRVSLEAFAKEKVRHEVSEADRDLPRRSFEDGFDVKAVRRNITRRRHNPISGYSIALQATVWAPWMGSDVDRVNYQGEGRLYLELWHDHVLALRMAAIHSTGPDRDSLSLKDRVRAYDSGDPRGTDVAWANAEFRFPIWRDIDWVTPAELVLLKDVRGIVFTDVGVISLEENVMNMLAYPVREEWHWSVGVSLQFDLFLVERKYLPVIFTVVKALDRTEDAPAGIKFEVNFELAF